MEKCPVCSGELVEQVLESADLEYDYVNKRELVVAYYSYFCKDCDCNVRTVQRGVISPWLDEEVEEIYTE